MLTRKNSGDYWKLWTRLQQHMVSLQSIIGILPGENPMASPFSWFNNLCLVTCLFLEATVSQVAIAWLLHRPTVASVVIGARTTKQLEENMKAVNVHLTPEDVSTINTSHYLSFLLSRWSNWMSVAKNHCLTHMRWYLDYKRVESEISKLNSIIQ